MLFSSITFLYYFFPITLILYFSVPKALKNSILLLASLIFYGWGEPKYLFLMLASILFGYLFGILIEKAKTKQGKLIFCISSVTISLSFLLFFKYADFLLENVGALTGTSLPLLKLALPIGISFYTFQMISYTVDVYRGEAAQKNIIHLATYITMFPQLIAGPIVRYSDIALQLKQRTHSLQLAGEGFRRFTMGLAKKILIANQLGELCHNFRVSDEKSLLFYWLYGIAFSLHIYFDFSGYSDMAIGLGKIFGFQFLENFNYPFISKSITEFWRRWHMSLGTWFRDYVYVPMGGNRVSTPKWLLNLFVVWFLTGFWHGAAWNFMLWGLFFALFLVFEKLFLGRLLKHSKILSHFYVLFFVMISFILFNATNLNEATSDILGLFSFGKTPLTSPEAIYHLRSFGVILLIAILGSTPYPKEITKKLMTGSSFLGKVLSFFEPVFLFTLLLVMTGFLADGSFNPFLYFRF